MNEWVEALLGQAREALPQVEGELHVPGLSRPVEVIRDRWGVPHIYADSLPDLFFAQGFVMGQERTFQTDLTLRVATGRLATLLGEFAMPLDRFFRTVGLNRAGRRIGAGFDDRSVEIVHAMAGGYAAGFERLPAPPIEYRILELDPEFPETDEERLAAGGAVGAFMSWILNGNWDAELLRVAIADAAGYEAMLALFPDIPGDPSVVVPGKDGGELGRRRALDILKTAPRTPKWMGSNNWVVAGSRSVTGKPLLANDPHLAVQMPSIWFECHLSAPGYEVSGVTLPGVPGVVIGHTPHHAWGFTNVGGDTQDLYLEKLKGDRTASLYEGRWEPATLHREEILVRGRDEPFVLEVPETRHGPILDSYLIGIANPELVVGGITRTYALRWVGASHGIMPSTLVDIAAATSFGEFRGALRGWESPGQNIVYADVEGTIGYQCTGLYPIRRRGDGTLPVPGWTAEYEWDGFVPFEELPWSENPEQGFIATANQRIHDDSYPWNLGKDFLPPFRARRIVELLAQTERHSKETFRRIHGDTVSLPAREIVPFLVEVEPATDRQKAALAHLEGWDGDLAADSVAAAIYEVWGVRLATAILLPMLGRELFDHFYARRQWTNSFQVQVLPTLLRYPTDMWFGTDGVGGRDAVLATTLEEALDELTEALGEDMESWRWGALHTARFAHPLTLLPGLEELFVGGEVEVGGDEQTIHQGLFEPGAGYTAVVIPSWRHIIDLSDIDASVGIHTTGQSGNPASPHYRDFVEPWSKVDYHPLPFTRPKVEEAAESSLTLTPG